MNTITPLHGNDFEAAIKRTSACSRYIQRLLDTDTDLADWLRENYMQPCTPEAIRAWFSPMQAGNEAEVSGALRKLRKKVMLNVLTRDLNGLSNLDEVVSCMTALAELTVTTAQTCAMQALIEVYGQPVGDETGKTQELLIIGMGKLGGRELNVSSDIDLIFVYPEDGRTNGERSIDNNDFFSRLGRKIIALINDITADGYVFRVDMRLRPYGDSGALVTSFAALEEYLVTQGREWERYAWIKARVISPADSPEAEELSTLTKPFIFRKYLDFGAFESMRKLHVQIRQEVQRRDRLNNVKLGPGGIREIEFIAQVFQLIRGGPNPRLRIRPTQKVLHLLVETGHLSAAAATELNAAYIFLRNLEHRLQYLDDQQTQDLPESTTDQEIIASAMNYSSYQEMLLVFNQHRDIVSKHFEEIFSTQNQSSGVTASFCDSPTPSQRMSNGMKAEAGR